VPRDGLARRRALQLIALATGAIDKIGAAAYERLIRLDAAWRSGSSVAARKGRAHRGARGRALPADAGSTGVDTTACMLRYVAMVDPTSCRRAAIRRLTPSPREARRARVPGDLPADYAVPRSA